MCRNLLFANMIRVVRQAGCQAGMVFCLFRSIRAGATRARARSRAYDGTVG